MIRYLDSPDGIAPEQLHGFFEGWPNKPTPEAHLLLLQRSDEVVLALDEQTQHIVGFITALSDDVLAAYIPFLEVLSEYRGRGIGRELMQRMLRRLDGLYMVDVICDPDTQPFYEKLDMQRASGAVLRRYQHQAGRPLPR